MVNSVKCGGKTEGCILILIIKLLILLTSEISMEWDIKQNVIRSGMNSRRRKRFSKNYSCKTGYNGNRMSLLELKT